MKGVEGKVVAITGASSGIGEASAKALAAAGARLVIGARRTDRLQRLAAEIVAKGGNVRFHTLDVTRRDEVKAFTKFAVDAHGRLDVLVNNAGIMPLSRLDAGLVDDWDAMVDVNVKGVLYGIAAALPIMQAQGAGQIVNIASVGGHAVSPTAAVYCATKFAVRAISDGLRQEMDKLRVTVISPGVATSELADNIADPVAREAMRAWRAVAISAETVADAIAYAISQPDDVDVSEIVVRPTASAN